MASKSDSIDVHFVGNPSGNLSSYPEDLDRFIPPSSISEPYIQKYKIEQEKKQTIAYFIFNNYKSFINGDTIVENRSFGIFITLKNFKVKRKDEKEILLFLKDFLESEITSNTIIFNSNNLKLYRFENFNKITTELQKIIIRFKKVFINEFEGSLKPITKVKKTKKAIDDIEIENHSIENDTTESNLDKNNTTVIILIFLFALGVYYIFDPSNKILLKAENITKYLNILFVSLYVLLGITILLKLFEKKESIGNTNRTKVILSGIALLVGTYTIHKHIFKTDFTEVLAFSISENKIDLQNKKKKSQILLCMDISGSSNEEITSKIPKWFIELKKDKIFWKNSELTNTDIEKLIDNKVTEFDLLKAKALKIIYDNQDNTRLITFGNNTKEILFQKVLDTVKSTKYHKAKFILSLKNDNKDTNFTSLFIELQRIIKNDIISSNKTASIVVLSDFVHEINKNFEISESLEESFNEFTSLKSHFLFNFLFFDYYNSDKKFESFHSSKHSFKSKCFFCHIKANLNKKKIHYEKNKKSSPPLVLTTIFEDQITFLYDYSSKSKVYPSTTINYKSNHKDSLDLSINTISNELYFVNCEYVDHENIPKQKTEFYTNEHVEKIQPNKLIKIQYEQESSKISDEKGLFLFIKDIKDKIIHKFKIITKSKLDNHSARVAIALIVLLFFLTSYHVYKVFKTHFLWSLKKYKPINMKAKPIIN